MKNLLILILVCFSQIAFGSGKLQVEPGYYFGAQKVGGTVGLAIEEHLFSNIFYKSWTGIGAHPQLKDPNFYWASSDQDLIMYKEKWAAALGVGADYGLATYRGFNELDYNAHLKVSYNLW